MNALEVGTSALWFFISFMLFVMIYLRNVCLFKVCVEKEKIEKHKDIMLLDKVLFVLSLLNGFIELFNDGDSVVFSLICALGSFIIIIVRLAMLMDEINEMEL